MEESDILGGVALPGGPDGKKRRVTYFYEPSIGDYYYGQGHPMKPHRIRMAHNLIIHYSLQRLMEIFTPFKATADDIFNFHSDDYVQFLSSVSPTTVRDHVHTRNLKRFNVGEDCPVFDGLFEFCQASAGGSIGAAVKMNRGEADIAINWAGGLHHAKKSEASGFCYVNDIVLGTLELLKVHKRVLYVDIDIHHGDGVEEAFFTTDRVMTVSFHKFGDFFPGTGHIKDVGNGSGKHYALNVPLNDGLDDDSFRGLFRPIIQKVMEVYQPDAVVLQCGADSLSGDRLGCFNLSVKGHADCVRFIRSFNVPLMLLGGGGYTMRNVARCWCYETAVAVGVEPDNKLPYNEYYEYFGPDYTLHVKPSHSENKNTPQDMDQLRNYLLEQISRMPHAPSVQFQMTPPTSELPEEVSLYFSDTKRRVILLLFLHILIFCFVFIQTLGCRKKSTLTEDQNVAYGVVTIMLLMMMMIRSLDIDLIVLMTTSLWKMMRTNLCIMLRWRMVLMILKMRNFWISLQMLFLQR